MLPEAQALARLLPEKQDGTAQKLLLAETKSIRPSLLLS
jgi:hypothetical protein